MTQDEVASELYMTAGKVRLLEQDDFEHLHSDTFIRGYLRAYANLLKVDAGQVMAAYDECAKNMGWIAEPKVEVVATSNGKIWRFALLLLSLLLVAWLISMWFLGNKKEPQYLPSDASAELSKSTKVLPQSEGVDAEAAPAATTKPSASAAENVAVPDAVATSVEGVGSADAAGLKQVVAPDQEPQVLPVQTRGQQGRTLDELRLEFADECWLEVSDANGDVLVTELERAGASLNLKGQAPFNVKLGNAPSAKIYLNGQSVDVPATRGTNVATLKIGQ